MRHRLGRNAYNSRVHHLKGAIQCNKRFMEGICQSKGDHKSFSFKATSELNSE